MSEPAGLWLWPRPGGAVLQWFSLAIQRQPHTFGRISETRTTGLRGIIGTASRDSTDQSCPGLLCQWFASLARLSKERGREQEGSVDVTSLMALESGAVPAPEFSSIPGSGRNISFQAPVSLVLILILGLL